MRTSDVLRDLARQPGDRLTLATIVSTLGDRSFALLVVVLGLPNCIPMPPPIPTVGGLLLGVIAAQILVGRATPWLPSALLRKSVARVDVERVVRRALPVVSKLESWSRPRLFQPPASALSGMLLLAIAVGMLTCAPIVGQVPFGIAACLVGLGQVERDGVLVLAGLLTSLVGAVLSASFVYAVFIAGSTLI